MLRRFVACVCFALTNVFVGPTYCQVPDDWQVLRIFVPEEEVGSLVPNDYNPVELEDLARALAREATRRSQLQSSPHIAEAIYVLRCSSETLTSDQSRWFVKSPLPNASLKLDDISVALRNSGLTPSEDKPLLPSLRFLTDGTTSISKIVGDTNYWFGMSLGSTANIGNQFIYDFRLPAATMAKMLISAPESTIISSPDVVVTQVSNPREYLPENWPNLPSSEGHRWYIVHLSGKSKFRLATEITGRNDQLDFEHYVRRSSLVYTASEKGLELLADFELERLSSTTSLQMNLDKSLRTRSITINGTGSDYRVLDTSDQQSTIEIPLNSIANGIARVRIEAVAETSYPFDGVLPWIDLPRGFAWEGKTTLLTEDGLLGTQLSNAGSSENANPRLETTTIGKRWVLDWLGSAPRLRASIQRTAPSCKAETFTRLTVQENWISATTNLQMHCSSMDSSDLRLRVGSGWFIDDLTIEKSDVPIVTDLPDGETGDIVLTWERSNGEMSIDVQVVAHFPMTTDTEQLSLEAPRVISVVGGSQNDHYAMEQTGRFQIQPNPILQRLELNESELPAWQTPLLSRAGTAQLFQGMAESIPPLVMNRSSGTYTSKVITTARVLQDSLLATYSIEVTPTAGAIDAASCLLAMPPGVALPTWRITEQINGESIQVTKAVVNSTRESGDEAVQSDVRFDLQLPDSTSNKFVMQCELQFPMAEAASVNLPLVTVPIATETWLVLPRNLELNPNSVGIIALPRNVCCDSHKFDSIQDNHPDSTIGFRYDPSVVSSVTLHPTPSRLDRGAWIWSDTLTHRLYNDGRMAHQNDLLIFAPDGVTLAVNLPSSWNINRVLLDGIVTTVGQQLGSSQVLIQIPRGKQVQVAILASSQGDRLAWFSRCKLSKPTFSLPSLNSSDALWLQPGRISLAEVFAEQPLSLARRLQPGNWWQRLSPSQGDFNVDEPNLGDWRKVALRFTRSEAVRTESSNGVTANEVNDSDRTLRATSSEISLIDRSSLCAMCIAILLAGSGIFFWLLGDRASWWWLSISVAVVGILVVPAMYISIAQLTLLSLLGGLLARLIRVVTGTRANSNNASRRGSTIVRASTNAAAVLLTFFAGSLAFAQDSAASKTNAKFPSTYGVLIPLNSDGELSAKHVYAPRKLMNILNSSETAEIDDPSPQILGAKYMLKISGGTSLTASYVQEFTAEFDLLFNSIDASLRLPFRANQLQLLRGSVSGQGVFIGPRLQQTSDAITYRPPEAGRVRLRLQLIPTTSTTADRTGIELEIPRIASSGLEVIADDSLDVNIKAIGSVRRLTASSWNAELGPADRLRVDWPTRPQRTPMPNQSLSQSDTWLHVNEGQLVADCQIRVSGARALPKQIRVSVDNGWEPVGVDWMDAKLISSEPSPVGNRRIYLLNRETVGDRAIIRTTMVPRHGESASTLAVPFFSLSESSPTGRTLALSLAGKPRWKLSGTELWNRLNPASSDLEWDSGKPAASDLWRIPSGGLAGSLTRINSDVSVVDETCALQLLSTKTTLEYRASWSQPTDSQLLRLEVPLLAEAKSVRLNGVDADFQLSEREGRSYLLVNTVRMPSEIRLLEIQMQLASSTGEPANLPRIVLMDTVVSRSLYQVNCGAELVCNLIEGENTLPENRFKFTQPVTDPTLMLSTLTAPVGAVELANSHRDSASLPVRYQVVRRSPVNVMANAMALTRTEQGWRATVEVLLPADQSSEFVFFDVPTTIRDLIESSGSPYRVAPSGAQGRSTLCLIPQAAEVGLMRARFAFRLPAVASSQSLTVPDIFFLGQEVSRPILALPTKIDAQSVRWLRAGRRLPDDWLTKSGLGLTNEECVFFEMSDSQQQVAWRPSETASNPAEVVLAWAVLDQDSDGHVIGAINYWIEPNNHLDVALNIPSTAQLIGVQSGSTGAIWHAEESGSIRVLLQPNYLPVQLRVLLRWPTLEAPMSRIPLPTIQAAGIERMPIAVLATASDLVNVEAILDETTSEELRLRKLNAASQVDAMLADTWSKLLLKSLPIASDLQDEEFSGWIRNWSPQAVGLQGLLSLNPGLSSGLNPGMNTGDTSNAERDTVAGFWNWYLNQTTASKSELRDSGTQISSSIKDELSETNALFAIDAIGAVSETMSELPGGNAKWFLVDVPRRASSATLSLQLLNTPEEQPKTPLAIAAVIACLISLVLYLLYRRARERAFEILASHPWLYWVFLAFLAWLFIPVVWPSVVVGLSSIGMLCAQMLNSRRRQLAMRR